MKLSTFLEIFLLVDIFIAGAAAAVALRHGRAHMRGKEAKKNEPTPSELSHATREQLLKEASEQFEEAMSQTTAKLQNDMAATAERINKLLDHIGTDIVGKEMESYRDDLIHLRKTAQADMSQIGNEIARHEAELKAKMAGEVEAEKQKLIARLDTGLADAVASFLVETLQHNVDLGAQTAYLTAMLEEHKAELIKGVSGEPKAD
jgi:hypothetical protein